MQSLSLGFSDLHRLVPCHDFPLPRGRIPHRFLLLDALRDLGTGGDGGRARMGHEGGEKLLQIARQAPSDREKEAERRRGGGRAKTGRVAVLRLEQRRVQVSQGIVGGLADGGLAQLAHPLVKRPNPGGVLHRPRHQRSQIALPRGHLFGEQPGQRFQTVDVQALEGFFGADTEHD